MYALSCDKFQITLQFWCNGVVIQLLSQATCLIDQ